ncbi:MAG: PRC-barrel domain-containing protein [Candidatus Lindowbacteria bacterium]|nr:PRC-barrel domain-containing protein [Candidatus Lindowbacteria bacterium]
MRISSVLVVALVVTGLIGSAQAFAIEPAGRQMTGTSQQATMQSVFRASDFIGKTARNDRGDRFGSVNEILFAEDGAIRYIVLSRGGLFGFGGALVPIPYDLAKPSLREDQVLLSLDKAVFDRAPSFARNEWRKLEDPEYNRQVHAYYESGELPESERMEQKPAEEHPGKSTQEHPGSTMK